jgi:hypothetical protein
MQEGGVIIGMAVIRKDGEVVKCVRRMMRPDLVEWVCW